jgi:hypothetical protein
MNEKSKDWSTLSSTAYEINEKRENIYIKRIPKRMQLDTTRSDEERQGTMTSDRV